MSLYVRLNAEYASDDEFIEAGPMAELLYIRALCFCKRKLIDGEISTKQLQVIATGIPSPKRHAKALVGVGLWSETDSGWYIADWLKWNKSADEIETERLLARESGERGNHERWHVGEDGKPSPKCRICREERLASTSGNPIGDPIGGSNRGGSPKEKPEPEPEPEPEPKEKPIAPKASSSSKVTPPTETTKRSKIIDTVVDIRANGQAKGPKWRETVAADVEARHGAKIDQWLNKFPDAPVDALASALESGDSRGLAYFTYQHRPPPEPERRLSAEERAALMADAGAPEKFTRPRTEEA